MTFNHRRVFSSLQKHIGIFPVPFLMIIILLPLSMKSSGQRGGAAVPDLLVPIRQARGSVPVNTGDHAWHARAMWKSCPMTSLSPEGKVEKALEAKKSEHVGHVRAQIHAQLEKAGLSMADVLVHEVKPLLVRRRSSSAGVKGSKVARRTFAIPRMLSRLERAWPEASLAAGGAGPRSKA